MDQDQKHQRDEKARHKAAIRKERRRIASIPGYWAEAERQAKREMQLDRITAPENKAARSNGLPMSGRVTLKQFNFLVSEGFDGDAVKRWTKYEASQEIGRIINRSTKA